LIGKRLVQRLHERGDSVVLLTRKQQSISQPSIPFIKFVLWDAAAVSTWSAELETADAVINLSGEPIAAKRWTTEQKHRIIASRIISTRAIT
jgi:NAD dependent epimerase/dehydratase family enzyme